MTTVGVHPTSDGRPPSSADYDGKLASDDLAVSDEVLAMTSRFADLDMLEGGREIADAQPEKQETSEFEVRYPSSNLHNASSPKPSLTLPRRMQLGPTERPRDRGPVRAQVPPSERKRLPAPEIGRSIGHGLQTETVTLEKRGGKDGSGGDPGDKVVTKREDILRALFR